MGTSARSAVHRREPDPSSGLATHIGYPAPSYERHRRHADNGPWGRRPISRRGAPRVGPYEPREHDDSLGRRVQRMARGQDQPIVGHALSDPDGRRRDDPRALDPVGEAPVRHHDRDLVARATLSILPERRAVGRAVPGDRDRAALAGQRRARVVARALAQVAGVRCPRRRPCESPMRSIRIRPTASPSSVLRSSERAANASRRLRVGQLLERLLLDRRRLELVQRGQLVLQVALLVARVERGDRLLPQQRRAGVGEQQRCRRRSARSRARAAPDATAAAVAARCVIAAAPTRCRRASPGRRR